MFPQFGFLTFTYDYMYVGMAFTKSFVRVSVIVTLIDVVSFFCNCSWVPWDVARVWGRHWLENVLAPNSQVPLRSFPVSRFLSLPLMSILKIAR